jgi:hypothetical protein
VRGTAATTIVRRGDRKGNCRIDLNKLAGEVKRGVPTMTFKREYSIQDILAFLNLVVVAVSVWLVVEQLRSSNEQLKQNRIAHETMIELERRNKALDFIARWNDESMVNLRAKVLHAEEGKEDRHGVQALLNFYEEMALAVLNRAANGDICLRYFRNMLLATYGRFKGTIEGGPGYPHLKQLHKEWQQAPATLPPLPSELDAGSKK